MMTIDPTSLSASDINILAVTIVCEPNRCEVVTYITHSPEVTVTADGATRTVSERRFPRRAVCPVATARRLYSDTRTMYPHAIVQLVNA
jgi:hypothetical protein